MYKVYLKQAWALKGQNRFFTAVYIIGTGLAISMVMAIAVVYHIRTANIAPEVSRLSKSQRALSGHRAKIRR